MTIHDFLKDKAKGKKVFIKIKDNPPILGYTIPFEEITFIEDCPMPFCCFIGGSLVSHHNEKETVIIQFSQISEFRIIDDDVNIASDK